MCKCNKKHNQSLCFQSVRKTRDLDVENNVVSAVSHCNYNIKNKEPEVKNAECSVLLQTCTSCVRSPLDDMAAVAEWYGHWIVAGFVTSSSPVPLKTRRVGQRCTLNLSRAEMSSRWCGVVVRRGGASSGVVHVT
ncbi:uncharacterized protein TNCV_4451511 [Trichonephila clavipes]|nr:uncharacterized protein TNCV_4451511 [Trichonephila clavipes]